MSDTVDCPYCYKSVEIDTIDLHEEDVLFEWECPHCDKMFAITASLSFYYDSQTVDCWNGVEHQWDGWHSLYIDEEKKLDHQKRYCRECDTSEHRTVEV